MPVSVDELNKSTTPCFSSLAIKEGLTPRKLIKEINLMAFSDVADHCEVAEGGELRFKTFKNQGIKRRALQSLEEKTVITESKDGNIIYKTSTVKFKLHPKNDAIDMGLCLHGMKKPAKIDVNHNIDKSLFDSARKVYQEMTTKKDTGAVKKVKRRGI
jgi:hypothetical protein